MASSYYWSCKKNDAWNRYKRYGSQYDQLKVIRNGLDQSTCVKDVNSSIDKCVEKMKKALNGSTKFTTNADAIGNYRLRNYGGVPRLNSAYTSITTEMNRLSSAKDQAYNDYTYYKQKEREAREAEQELANG